MADITIPTFADVCGDIPEAPGADATINEKIAYGINMAYFGINATKAIAVATSDLIKAVARVVVDFALVVKCTAGELQDLASGTVDDLKAMAAEVKD